MDTLEKIKVSQNISDEDKEKIFELISTAKHRYSIARWCEYFASLIETNSNKDKKQRLQTIFEQSIEIIEDTEVRTAFHEVLNEFSNSSKDLPSCFKINKIFDRWFVSMIHYSFFTRDIITHLRYFSNKNNTFFLDYYGKTAGNCYIQHVLKQEGIILEDVEL